MIVEYGSNNSGGDWWLSDKDWVALEEAGWKVNWVRDDSTPTRPARERFLGALAMSATVEADNEDHAKRMWQEVVNQDPEEEGCACCGQPHSFWGSA